LRRETGCVSFFNPEIPFIEVKRPAAPQASSDDHPMLLRSQDALAGLQFHGFADTGRGERNEATGMPWASSTA